MVDITNKSSTLRTAIAQAIVKVSKPETILAIQNDTVPKGIVFAMSKAAGLLGVKRTPDILPDCCRPSFMGNYGRAIYHV